MSLDAEQLNRLADWIGAAAGDPALRVLSCERLSGGAIQENLALTLSDGRQVVLRTTSAGTISESRTREEEFLLLRAAKAAGVTVANPLWYCADESVIGRAFAITARVGGTAAGHKLVRDPFPASDREAFVRHLGEQLARIHSIQADLPFLGARPVDPGVELIASIRGRLDSRDEPRPAVEWGLRWLERHAPAPATPVLAHRDFRTGNYMVDATGLTAILDWEFSGWSDAYEDLGWFCAKCWRFGAIEREGGGIGSRAAFLAGYGGTIDPARLRWWEVMAHCRWAAIALEQADRHISGAQPSLELALTGRIVHGLEYDILTMTGPSE